VVSVAAAVLMLLSRNFLDIRFDEFWIYPASCLVFLLTHSLGRLRKAGAAA
jgi:hypothetical protein